jgi:hypothetical protein
MTILRRSLSSDDRFESQQRQRNEYDRIRRRHRSYRSAALAREEIEQPLNIPKS